MPIEARRIARGRKLRAAPLLLRGLVAAFAAILLAGPLEPGLRAQTVSIRLINGKNGHPMAHACVNVWVGKGQKAAMAIPTDKQGIARLRLTDKEAEVNTQHRWKTCGYFGVVDPVVKYADTIRVNAGYVACLPHVPDYSWLAHMTFSTEKVLQSGLVTANACGKAKAVPRPGEIVLFVRPLTWWEKLKE